MSTQVTVSKLPACDFHPNEDHDAEYDFRTKADSPGRGSWGNGCAVAWKLYGHGKLGTGFGQRLILAKGSE